MSQLTIKHVLRSLSPETMKEVMANFNAEQAYMLQYNPTTFLGVHVEQSNYPHLRFIEVAGAWCLGETI